MNPNGRRLPSGKFAPIPGRQRKPVTRHCINCGAAFEVHWLANGQLSTATMCPQHRRWKRTGNLNARNWRQRKRMREGLLEPGPRERALEQEKAIRAYDEGIWQLFGPKREPKREEDMKDAP